MNTKQVGKQTIGGRLGDWLDCQGPWVMAAFVVAMLVCLVLVGR